MAEVTRRDGGSGRVLSYRDLDIYQLAHDLAVAVHQITLSLPRFEAYEQASQVRRSSKSVCANIVEGFCRRRYKPEFIRYLTFAWGSYEETLEHLRLLKDTGSLAEEAASPLQSQYRRLSSMIYGFPRSVERDHKA
jgi:four helix bundle protein